MGSVFNIVGCTAALLCHFVGNPTAHPDFRQLHRDLLNALRDAPCQVRLHSLGHVQGHCYAFKIDDDLPSDRCATSTIILFEDGKPLRGPHFRDPPKIASEGRGTYQHFDRMILFSTSDNTSPLTNGRKYVAVHSLSTDPATFQRLIAWKSATKATAAARLFEMLQVWSAKHFSYAAMSGDGTDVSLSGVRLAIDRDARMQLTARALSARVVVDSGTQWDFEVAGLATAEAPDAHWDVRGRIDVSRDAANILMVLKIDGPGGLSLSFERESSGVVAVKLGRLHAIRAAMLGWFDSAAALDNWMAGIARLAAAPLSDGGLGLALDQDGVNTFAQMLSDSGTDQQYELIVRADMDQRHATLKRAAS